MTDQRRGFLLGVTAYSLWGLFPLYWPLLQPSSAVEILAHRVLWSALTTALLLAALHRWARLRATVADRRTLRLLAAAAVVISLNWGGYIYGVNNERVLETSLGYYANPLVTVLLGVVVLGERLRRAQWVAMALAALAVVVLTFDYGRLPWVALLLAGSFAVYGLLKKQAASGAVESLTVETAVLAPVAGAYVAWLAWSGSSTFGTEGAGHALLMTTSGVVTAVPLLCFGAAATRISLTTIGLLQYLAPTIQFVLAVAVLGEDMPPARWAGFTLVWIALVVFTVEALHHRRRQLPLVAEASAI